ncbi:helix-turn-helix transcriptional regulator [Clostridium perfringens]|uniref:helix-turn-helix domain-containing protein n=1 Tax=Clostridium perfringens TaxID=1502 RepID=UPI001158FFD1|nr:helix-turn-helix transcriptional regulator [Clostridium perfringens]MDB2042775.1 helix-turn-helix transcriptional regulator [Clostridium perfringens]MDB2055264.1 helix-turn-helix transcriptional regulator [Clostridium perfringens]MDK0647869.1 helix-turn-helix transcriptional regulator [Clostridium perfringens]MDK0974211.1 helix-turn-helix transcriptional regulator [Clostridium perfringens]MDM0888667.1 helix-turn-helix transcriptional regulator [Clostridium perfringens]
MSNIGKLFKESRIKNGLTLQDVSIKTGISQSYISRIENNFRKEPSVKVVKSLSDVYELDFYKVIELML